MIRYEGREYDFDIDECLIPEWREIKRKYKLTIKGVMDGLRELDPDAITCVYWLLMRSDGKHDDLALNDDLTFNPVELMAAWMDDQKEKAEEQKKEDPTAGGSRQDGATPASNGSSAATSASSETSTSSSSPASAASARTRSTG